MRSPLESIAPQACICFQSNDECVCCDTEKVLRWIGYRFVGHGSCPPLTQKQREWCLTEIGSGRMSYGYRCKYENCQRHRSLQRGPARP
jgi:hypothetical protein